MKLGKLFEAVVETVTLPVAIAKDVIDFSLHEEPDNTKRKIKKISNNLDRFTD